MVPQEYQIQQHYLTTSLRLINTNASQLTYWNIPHPLEPQLELFGNCGKADGIFLLDSEYGLIGLYVSGC